MVPQDGNIMNSIMGTNMISMMSMKENVSAWQIIFGIMVMNFMSYLPYIQNFIMKYINNYITKNKKKIENYVNVKKNDEKTREIISSLKLIKNDKNSSNIVFDSINFYIIHNNNAKFLHYKKDFTIVNTETFKINETIYCKVSNDISNNNEGDDYNYVIELFSYDLKLFELKQFIDDIKQKYIHEQNNKLGQQKFYFDEKNVILPIDQEGNIKYDTAPKKMNFTMTPFYTNKSLSNIFGSHLQNLKERVDMFLNNKEWYKEKGIPYTLGIMLHGPPGTGKTSIIKAISKDSQRHVFNIKFNKNTTQTQLRDLFFNESVCVLQDGRTETFNIPINERIYVIEDIDCLTDVLNERKKEEDEIQNANINKEKMTEPKNLTLEVTNRITDFNIMENNSNLNYSSIQNVDTIRPISEVYGNQTREYKEQNKNQINPLSSGEELNLSFILNLLDGILETPGRILIITSNHPEKLDSAFIRPGRIDVNLNVGYCNIDMIIDMFNFFYNKDCNFLFDDNSKKIINEKNITPAELNRFILNNYNSPEKAFNEIIET